MSGALIGALVIGAAGAGISAYSSDQTNKSNQKIAEEQTNKTYTPFFQATPTYAEADAARSGMSQKLGEWSTQPGYGAISPDWESIWNQASQKINQYYGGSPTSTGAFDVAKSNAAARGVSDSPALQAQMGQLQAAQGQQLGTEAATEAQAKTSAEELGRQNWMTQMNNMMNQQVAGNWSGGVTTGNGTSSSANLTPNSQYIGDIASNMVNSGAAGQMGVGVSNWWNQNFGKTQSSITPQATTSMDEFTGSMG